MGWLHQSAASSSINVSCGEIAHPRPPRMTWMLSVAQISLLSSTVKSHIGTSLRESTYAIFVVGIDIVVNWNDVIRQTSLRRFRAHKGEIHYTIVHGD